MIHFIKGRLAGSFANTIVVENNGIGYEISMPSSSAAFAAGEGQEVMVYTAMIVREDDISLYGFDDRESLAMFRMLTGVTGIGSKGAVSILSALTVNEIKKAIAFDDPAMLAKAQGIGKKTAQRLVLELKDKVDGFTVTESSDQLSVLTPSASGAGEAIDALVSLGYTKSEASEAVAACGLADGRAEDYIKAALKKLSRF